MSERTTVTKSISLPPGLAATLKYNAEEDGIPESLIVRWALEKYFEAGKKARRGARKEK
jgi:predicted DNA-binding protein